MRHILVCLHGWGGSKESFTELRDALRGSNITILTPDLPGFGAEPEPTQPWTTDDYAEWVEQWLEKEMEGNPSSKDLSLQAQREVNTPDSAHRTGESSFDSAQDDSDSARDDKRQLHVLGHSHGGRIAIKMALRGRVKIEHLYLCAAAGIKHSRHIKRIIGLTLAKSGKFLLAIPGLKMLEPTAKKVLYKLVRVHDYEQASPGMRQTLINVTREDLTPLLDHINIPTDIFWGKDDRMTPFADGQLMHEKIGGSTLHAFAGTRHRVHRDKAAEIAQVICKRVG